MTRNEAIESRAAEFVARRSDPDWSEVDEAALEMWLAEAMAHKAAYWRLAHHWARADRLAALGPNAVPPPRPWRRWAVLLAAASIVVTGIGGLVLQTAQRSQFTPVVHLTEVGVRDQAVLADGSRVELNTATELRTSLSDYVREVWLDRGEAYFDVARDNRRPFVVHAGERTITVLGTKFTVRRDEDEVRVAVIEGRVRVASAASNSAGSHILAAGETAAIADGATLVTPPSPARVENATLWREGMLAFDNVPLSEAVAEFNRYNRQRLVVADPATGAMVVGGTFQSSNTEGFVRLLERVYGLRIERGPDEIVIGS